MIGEDPGAGFLSEALRSNSTLVSLNLRNIGLQLGIVDICEALMTNSTLTELQLNGNETTT